MAVSNKPIAFFSVYSPMTRAGTGASIPAFMVALTLMLFCVSWAAEALLATGLMLKVT